MIPVLSCMQMAAAVSGAGAGEGKPEADTGSIKHTEEAEGSEDSCQSNDSNKTEQTNALNNNYKDGGISSSVEDVVNVENLEAVNVTETDPVIDENDGTYTDDKELDEQWECPVGTVNVEDYIEIEDEVSTNKTNKTQLIVNTEEKNDCQENTDTELVLKGTKEIIEFGTLQTEGHSKEGDKSDNTIKAGVIKPKKSHLSYFISKCHQDEVSLLKFGSVDVADEAHIELQKLQEDTTEKSLQDELNEIGQADDELLVSEEIVRDRTGTLEANFYEEEQFVSLNTKQTDLAVTEELTKNNFDDTKTKYKTDSVTASPCEATHKVENNKFSEENCNPVDNPKLTEKYDCLINHETENECVHDTELAIINATEIVERSKTNVYESGILINDRYALNSEPDCSDYDADSSDIDAEQIERTNEVKSALLTCLKGKRETFEREHATGEAKCDTSEYFSVENSETTGKYHNETSETFPGTEDSCESKTEVSNNKVDQTALGEVRKQTLTMPETRDNIDGSVSPSLMFASCRYRWEKTILTQSQSVVFVTLNTKEIEPIKLEWSESSKCFYSEEAKVPVGTYIGSLVVDGMFYPVEDIQVKHYTFEIDLYLKEDILEDEVPNSGVAKAEDFVKQKQLNNGSQLQSGYHSNQHIPDRASVYKYPSYRATMEQEPSQQTEPEASINRTNKYEELIRSQLNQNKGALDDSIFEPSTSHGANISDVEGRRTPVGEDGGNQYQDTDKSGSPNITRPLDGHHSVKSENGPSIDDFFEPRKPTAGPVHNGLDSLDRDNPQSVIDDVLGSGHARTPIYSTESPVYSKHSSAHSSARQTPILTEGGEQVRPESVGSVGSVRSAGSISKHVLNDLLSDALGCPKVERSSPASEQESRGPNFTPTRPESVGSAHSENSRRAINDMIEDSLNVTKTPPPSRESSRPQTPPEQIDDVLNPADRHSPIRREFLAGSRRLSDHSAKGSTSGQSSAHSSRQHTPQREFISNSLRSSQEKLYSSHSSTNSVSSRPQSLTSEQELTQYYENLTDNKNGLKTVTVGTNGLRTESASSLPVIGSQQRYTPDKRSMTPDNHIRVPAAGSVTKTSLLTSRTPPRVPLSNASSRTVTPVNTETDTEIRLKEQMNDLENTILNLRNVLTSREQEILELKNQFSEVREINEKLHVDLDRHRAKASPGLQLERQLEDACNERDALSAEISLLRDELRRQKEPGLNSYDPNSPATLQKKIEELNSQIQDLHEANEGASEEIQAAERKVKHLAAENETLRVTRSESLLDAEDENKLLKSEVQRLRESSLNHNEATDYRLKIELQQVREDNRNLRERNYQLHDDNIRLKEELTDLRKALEFMDSKVQHKDDRVRQFDALTDSDKVLKPSYHREVTSTYSRLSGAQNGQQTDKNLDSYSMSRSNYDTQRSEQTIDDYSDDILRKSEATRYGSYRLGPDGGASDKLRPSLGYSRPLTPERLSVHGTQIRDGTLTSKSQERIDLTSMTVDRSDRDLDSARRKRNRTSSAEINFRSTSLPAYHGELSKTTPALTGRSRAIYEEISDKRSRPKPHSEDDNKTANECESEESEHNPKSENTHNSSNKASQAHSSQVFMNRFLPPNPVSEVEETNADTRRFHLAEKLDPMYARREMRVTQQRETLEKEIEMLEKKSEQQSILSTLPIVTKAGYCDDGNMSDTPTDILVNIKPIDKIPATLWSNQHQRRGSLGSDASNSSFSDIDEQITTSVRKRSKSADGREILRRMGPAGSSSKENHTLSRTLSPAPSAGLRTVTLRPIPTQHNKSALSLSSSLNSLTQGLRPFAPRSAQDLQINDVIKFSRQGGKLSQGTIKFIGHLPGRGDIYLGVELDKEDGKHDGVFEGIRYFKCKPTKGVFVAYNKVVMAWTTY